MTALFGLDIGSYSIKALQAEKQKEGYKLISIGEIKTPTQLNSPSQTEKRDVANAISQLINDAKIKTKKVNLSLSESSVYSQVISLPFMSEKELASAIQFEAEQYVPVPLSEVNIEYLVLSTKQRDVAERRMEVLLIAAEKKAIAQKVELAEEAGLTPLSLEINTLSLTRVINLFNEGNILVLDLGHSATNIVILSNQKVKFIRTLNTGGKALTRAISRDLNMEFFQAEEYKVAYGLNQSVLEGKVAKAILPTFNIILTEIRKSLNFFNQRNPGIKINSLVVAGGGALMKQVNSYFASALDLEVITLDPFRAFLPDERLEKMGAAPRFATVVGLAIREDK